MDKTEALTALAALAHDVRLQAYQLLMQSGPDGMAAGDVAAALGLSPTVLSFHFNRLRHAGLLAVRRQGRLKFYSARFATMNALLGYLEANCCDVPAGRPPEPRGGQAAPPSSRRRRG